jgi:hypothetical protein
MSISNTPATQTSTIYFGASVSGVVGANTAVTNLITALANEGYVKTGTLT